MAEYALALIFGLGFGISLQKAGLSKYDKIVNVFRFKDMAVMKFMMTALVVAMFGVFGLQQLGLVELKLTDTYMVGNVVGGLIFGAGMAIGGL